MHNLTSETVNNAEISLKQNIKVRTWKHHITVLSVSFKGNRRSFCLQLTNQSFNTVFTKAIIYICKHTELQIMN